MCFLARLKYCMIQRCLKRGLRTSLTNNQVLLEKIKGMTLVNHEATPADVQASETSRVMRLASITRPDSCAITEIAKDLKPEYLGPSFQLLQSSFEIFYFMIRKLRLRRLSYTRKQSKVIYISQLRQTGKRVI